MAALKLLIIGMINMKQELKIGNPPHANRQN